MEWITKILFGISNSLLIPDILLLIGFFIYSIIVLGTFYGRFLTRRKNDAAFRHLIDHFPEHSAEALREALPKYDNALAIPYYRRLLETAGDLDYAEYLISDFESRATKDLIPLRILTKIGPMLGLMGTLISMSPALVGLSSGDVSGMAYNMQIVFATTVVGLVIAGVSIVVLFYTARWYRRDVAGMTYIANVLHERSDEEDH